jgi:prepilin-type N-terminal cleavage/methylation domain-containing protein
MRESNLRGGFTLIELLACLAILAVLISMGATGAAHRSRRLRLRHAGHELKSAIDYARQWAMTHQTVTTLTYSNIPALTDTTARTAYGISTDPHGLIGGRRYLPGGVLATPAPGALRFRTDGTLAGDPTAPADPLLTLTDSGAGASNVTVKIHHATGYTEILP